MEPGFPPGFARRPVEGTTLMMTKRTARRGLRALVCTTALALGVGVAAPAADAAYAKKPPTQKLGASWMANQIDANNGYLMSYGAPDPVNTAYAVIGLRATVTGATARTEAIAYLKTQLGAPLQIGGQDAPGAISYFIMAAVSAGEDPRAFGGTAPQNDLVARLLATQKTTGPNAGLFGVQDPTYDGAFRQGLALAALKAVKTKMNTVPVLTGLAWLINQQCANGLWMSYRSDTGIACPPADPDFFTGPDTNSTSMAAQGLAAWGMRPNAATALASLDAVQTTDGGFAFMAAPGQSSDPSSTALTIQAILAFKGNPNKAPWVVGATKPATTPYTALASFQLGCSEPVGDRGAYRSAFAPGPDSFSTVQATVAAAKKRLPLPKTNAVYKDPVSLPCPA